jgi:erythronate-4-phosphate dehydrogenase
MEHLRIVADSGIPFMKGLLEPYASVRYIKGIEISPVDVAEADVLIVRTRTRCDETLLKGSRVKLICTATVGFDHIDMEYCRKNGIEVFTASGSNSGAVAQWVATALAYINPVPENTTLGIVGVGNVGSLVGRHASRWGFRVLRCDPPRARTEGGDFISLENLAAQADIITLHIPLNRDGEDRTYHLIDRDIFRLIKPGAYILNSSRGEVVDTKAMIEALGSKGCNAIIDTWEDEPHIDTELLKEAALATPHIAGYSLQGRANGVAMIVDHLSERFGWPLKGWYPQQVERIAGNLPISWNEMRSAIQDYFDIRLQSDILKYDPAKFEDIRNNYRFREEFF